MREDLVYQRVNREAQLRRRIVQIIRPFMTPLSEWNHAVPLYLAVLTSHHSSGLDKITAYAALRAMVDEIREARAKFVAAVQSAPAHDRIDDMRISMEQLEKRLCEVVNQYGFENPRNSSRRMPVEARDEMSALR